MSLIKYLIPDHIISEIYHSSYFMLIWNIFYISAYTFVDLLVISFLPVTSDVSGYAWSVTTVLIDRFSDQYFLNTGWFSILTNEYFFLKLGGSISL